MKKKKEESSMKKGETSMKKGKGEHVYK